MAKAGVKGKNADESAKQNRPRPAVDRDVVLPSAAFKNNEFAWAENAAKMATESGAALSAKELEEVRKKNMRTHQRQKNARPQKGGPRAKPSGKRTREREAQLAAPAMRAQRDALKPGAATELRQALQRSRKVEEVVGLCEAFGMERVTGPNAAFALYHMGRLAMKDPQLANNPLARRTLARSRCKDLIERVLSAAVVSPPRVHDGNLVQAVRALALLDAMEAFPAETQALVSRSVEAIVKTEGKSNHVNEFLWALARGRYFPGKDVMDVVDTWLIAGGLGRLHVSKAVSFLWAAARVRANSETCLAAIQAWTPDPKRFSNQHLVTCLWSLSVMGLVQGATFEALWAEMVSRELEESALSNVYWVQIQQVWMSIVLQDSRMQALEGSERVNATSTSSWRRAMEAPKKVSGYQRQLEITLANMGIYHESEVACGASGGYSIDVSLPHHGVAIEMDGPSHQFHNMDVYLGATHMKQQHLTAMGWKVMSVPYREWDMLYEMDSRQYYIEDRLAELGLNVVPESAKMKLL